MKPISTLVALLLLHGVAAGVTATKPLQGFVLAGQSNMEGEGVVDPDGRDYNDDAGYELAGLVWYHGWNDGVSPKTGVMQYETNLVNMIRGVRKEFNAERQFLVGDAPGNGKLALLGGRTANAASFQTNSIEGWRVLVNKRLLAEEKAATAKALGLLRGQLREIVRVVPAPAVAKLREVTLWFSPEYPGVPPRAEYHPGADWLRDNGRDPAMVKGVEFTDVRNFEAETKRMPNFTLHELAHAYHDRVLARGFDNPEIKAAYERAKAGKSYDKVERGFGNGRPNTFERAYAMSNPMEYFAESTEAFFSRNDFFPFTREELKKHDPEMEKLLKRLWEGPKKAEEDEKRNGR